MPSFAYRAKKGPERIVAGTVDAADRAHAIAVLKGMDLSILELAEPTGAFGKPSKLGRAKTRDAAVFWRQLESLLTAGLPLVQALQSTASQCESTHVRRAVQMLHESVSRGVSLSSAVRELGGTFGPVSASILSAGELTGRLAEAAGQLADTAERQQAARVRMRSALLYPVFLFVVGVIVVSLLLVVVVPKFQVLFASYGQRLPLATRMLLSASRSAQSYGPYAGPALFLAAVGLYRATRQGSGRRLWHGLLLGTPYFGRLIRRVETARFAGTFGSLCSSGVRVLPALGVAAETVGNAVIAEQVIKVRDRVSEGVSVAEALREQEGFPDSLVNMVAVGEQSASLDRMLLNVASFYQQEVEAAASGLAQLVESGLIIVLAGMVAFVVAAILLPVFRASALVG